MDGRGTEPDAPAPARRRRWWAGGLDALASLLLPWECPVCGAGPEADADTPAYARAGRPRPFCDACRDELLDAAGPACARCAMPVGPWASDKVCRECRGRSLGFDAAVALGPYHGPLRALCLRLKHATDGWLARWLAELLADARPGLADEAKAGAVVAAVPLHWRRRLARGYNQSEALARALADRLTLPAARPLRRVSHSGVLAGLGRVERAKALRGAFRPRRGASAAVSGRTVLLVDDVLTTGATCGAAARALKAAGARRVVAVVIGRAEGRV